MIWMAKSTSNIFQDDDSKTHNVNIDWRQPISRKYKGKILEQNWVPNPNDTEHGSIPINTIVWAWMPKKEDCKKTKINKCVQVVLDLLGRI